MNAARSVVGIVLFAMALGYPVTAWAEGLEIGEVRTDNFPRVIVRFTANGPDGTPISDIRPGRLRIFENEAAQDQVDFYSLRESAPELWVSLVIDISGSMNDEGKLDQAKAAAKAFMARLRPKDRTAIVTFSDRVILQQQFTGDAALLRRSVDGLQAKGPTRMNDGLARGVSDLLRAREGGRRAAILVSDGADTDSQTELAEALRPAVEARIPIYTIGLGRDVNAAVLQQIAEETHGRYYAAPRASDLDYVFKLLSGQLSNQYEVWWPSSTVAASGSTVEGRLVVDSPGAGQLETGFSYVMPVLLRHPTREGQPVVGSSLRPVDEAPAMNWDLPGWWPLAAAALGALGIGLGYLGAILRLTRGRLQLRLQHYVASYQAATARQGQVSASRQSFRPMVLGLARVSHRLMPARLMDKVRHRLVLAGRPSGWHLAQFLSSQLMLALGLGMGGYILIVGGGGGGITSLAVIASLASLGYYLPHPWLAAKIKSRQKAIQRALPDALDLITVGVGAGLSLDGAILEFVEKARNALSQELANFLAELRMGRSRREALRGLQARTEVDDIKVLVASLLQAEELGMSLSETLLVQAEQMRMRRRQRAEEQAHKATIKMLFPMIFLIFPALWIVIMGPAIPGLLSFMGGGG